MKPFTCPINSSQFLPHQDALVASLSTADALDLRSFLVTPKASPEFSIPTKDSIKSVYLESVSGDIVVQCDFSSGVPQRIIMAALSQAPLPFLEKLDLLLFRKLRSQPPITSSSKPSAPTAMSPKAPMTGAVDSVESIAPSPSLATNVPGNTVINESSSGVVRMASSNGSSVDDAPVRIPSSSIKRRLFEMLDEAILDARELRWEIAKTLRENKVSSDNIPLKASGLAIDVAAGGCSLALSDAFFSKNISRLISGFQLKTLLALEKKAGSVICK